MSRSLVRVWKAQRKWLEEKKESDCEGILINLYLIFWCWGAKEGSSLGSGAVRAACVCLFWWDCVQCLRWEERSKLRQLGSCYSSPGGK